MRIVAMVIVLLALVRGGARADSSSEVFSGDYYRNASGTVTVTIPRLLAGVSPKTQVASGVRTIIWPASPVMVAMAFPPKMPMGKFGPLYSSLFKSLVAAAGFTIDPAAVTSKNGTAAGGTVSVVRFGPDAKGNVAEMAMTFEGDDSCAAFTFGPVAKVDAMAAALADNVRVGSKIARLADRAPAVRLAGVFQSKGAVKNAEYVTSWLVFDPRGYVSEEIVQSDLYADVEALVQRAKVHPIWVWTYTIENGAIALVPAGGLGQAKSKPFVVGKTTITYDGDEYFYVGPMDTLTVKLAGTWTSDSVISSNIGYGGGGMGANFKHELVLGVDGTASYGGRVNVNGAGNDATGDLVWTMGGWASSAWTGRYKSDGNHIRITTSGGIESSMLVLPYRDGDGKITKNKLVFDGSAYIRKD